MAGSKLPPQAYTRETLALAYEWLKSQPPSIREMATSADYLVSLYLQAKRRLKDGVHSYGLGDEQDLRSKQHFKSELKHLQEQVREFDTQENAEDDPPPEIDTETINRLIRNPDVKNPPSAIKKSQQPPLVYNNKEAQEDTVASPNSNHSSVLSQPQVQVVVQQPGHSSDRGNSHFIPPTPYHPGDAAGGGYASHPQHPQISHPAGAPPQQQPAPQGSYSQINGVRHELDPITKRNLEEVRRRLNLSSENEALRVLVAIGYDKVRQILPNN
ncbi:MAG: hypothetical protein KDD61_03995 [Bdellovibrionales bacterium]|nr:hypothetical protein [Bdellovibrionales bacterium]